MGETVAFIGLGRMGRAMAANLVSAGVTVRTWNRTTGKATPGAVECASAREAAAGAHFAVTMLADDAAVQVVVLGENGLLRGLREGAVHCGMSTISVALSRRLDDAHKAAKQQYVAAPVFGRPDAAEARKLSIVCGGDEAAVAQCRPLFEAMGQATYPVGAAAHASLTKLCGNFMIASVIEMYGEALALGEKAGLDPTRLAETLTAILFAGGPIPKGYGARIAATQFEPAGFSMPLGYKDGSLVLRAAGE